MVSFILLLSLGVFLCLIMCMLSIFILILLVLGVEILDVFLFCLDDFWGVELSLVNFESVNVVILRFLFLLLSELVFELFCVFLLMCVFIFILIMILIFLLYLFGVVVFNINVLGWLFNVVWYILWVFLLLSLGVLIFV